ncbi:TonB-dependent siderophore receptor [Algihabitans albus]|uniref:TonB-dependent siderophore receptor n=1 Tax=Algihabitans albus TaxID=2164067 RepID=UPI0013C34DE6|nr:TonB-dependent receptor [Algihabitans albus]
MPFPRHAWRYASAVVLSACSVQLAALDAARAQEVDRSNAQNNERNAAPQVDVPVLPPIEVTAPAFTQTPAGPVDGYRALTAVTGTRTETPLEQIPQSIQVIPRSLIEDQQDQTVQDALENVSGVRTPGPQETLLSSFFVRGFPADQFIDGMPIFGATNVFDTGSLVNVERIEVLKGPSATLYGGGTGAPLGGLINVVPRAPEFDAALTAGLRGGSFGTVNPFWDLNQPLVEDRLSLRFSGDFEQAESFIDFEESERVLLSPSLRAMITEDTELLIRGIYAENEYLEYSGLPAEAAVRGDFEIDRFRFSGASDTPDTEVRNALVQTRLTHDFNDALTGMVQASYYDSYFKENSSFLFGGPLDPTAPSVYPVFSGILETDVEQFNTNANLTYDFDLGSLSNTSLVGFEYDRTENPASLNFGPNGFLDFGDSTSDLTYLPPDGTFFSIQDNSYRTYAAYGQHQITLFDRLHLLGGLRWTRLTVEEKELGQDYTATEVTPRFGAALDVIEEVTAFASYGRGFRGVQAFTGTGPPKPEESEQIEVGLRFSFDRIGLSGSIAGYELIRQNVPTFDPANPGFQIQTGEQRARGAELDLIWQATAELTFLANYAYTNAKVTEDTRIPEGDRLARIPRHSGRVAARYAFLDGPFEGLGLGIGVTAASGREITLPNDLETDAYVVADAQLSYGAGPVTFGLSIENLTDEDYFEPYQFLGQSVVRPAQPRSVFATIRASF